MKTQFLSIILLIPLAAGALPAGEPAPEGRPIGLTRELIDQLVAEAQGQNPALEAASARADAAAEAVDSVRKWEDPVFSFGLWLPGQQGFSSFQMGNLIYGVEQKLPVFGRSELARDVAESAAAKERLNVRNAVEILRRDVTLALLDLALADENAKLAEEDLTWLDATLAAVDDRFRVGKASQVEWLKIQTERAKAADQLTTIRSMRGRQRAQLNRLVNRDLEAPWPSVSLPEIAGPVLFDDRLVSAALDFAPKLKVMQQEAAQDEAVARLTQRKRMPEIGVGLQARQYSGDGQIREGTMTVDFSLPWLNRRNYDADLRRDRANKRAAEHEADDYALSIRLEVHHLVVDLDAARRQALLYRDRIIPLTEQTLSSARAAWENNLGLFQDVLDARRMLVENRREQAQAGADQGRDVADLTFLTGIDDLPAFVAGDSAAMNH
jgi:outer membrane protein TolC